MTAVHSLRRKPAARSTWRSLVVPLDGSRLAEHALPLAGAIARAARARVRLVLIHELPPSPADQASARLYVAIETATRRSQRDYLRRAAARLRQAYGIPVGTVTRDGPIAEALTTWIDSSGADLVVMTTHGRGALGRAFVGSVADHVVRTVEAPVLLLRPEQDAPGPDPSHGWSGREILLPLDGSPLAEAALPPALELARLFGLPVSLLEVVQPLSVATDPPLPFPAFYDEQITGERRRQAQDYLDSMSERLRERGIEAHGAATVGWSVAGTLLDVARPERTALVVMATHGRGGLKRVLNGSVTDKLVRGADVPVLVVRPREGHA
jgi:nucleotide-binding universal stress UspA family protein